MSRCKCGSYAINLAFHGRDDTDTDSCDVCFWRNKAEALRQQLEAAQKGAEKWSHIREHGVYCLQYEVGECCTGTYQGHAADEAVNAAIAEQKWKS
jgi:hypothetical protein